MSEGDHRIRVARERRDRMRKRLLDAIMATYARHLQMGPPSVDDVIKEADVSRATFYKYFNSVEEALGLLGRELMDEMVDSLINLYGGKGDGFFRFTTGIQLFLLRSVIDPIWAAFVSASDELEQDARPLNGITMHLAEAREQGLVHFVDSEAAGTLAVGGMMEAIRYMVRSGNRSRAYVEDLAAMLLRGLGVDIETAREVVHERTIFIRGVGPDRLSWWRDPWS